MAHVRALTSPNAHAHAARATRRRPPTDRTRAMQHISTHPTRAHPRAASKHARHRDLQTSARGPARTLERANRDRTAAPAPTAHRRAPRRATRAQKRRASTPPRDANEFSARTHRVSKPRLEKTERGSSRCDVFARSGGRGGFYRP